MEIVKTELELINEMRSAYLSEDWVRTIEVGKKLLEVTNAQLYKDRAQWTVTEAQRRLDLESKN